MYFYLMTSEPELNSLVGKRLFIDDFEPKEGDFISVGTGSYKIIGIEHRLSIGGEYHGTYVYVRGKQSKDWYK